MYVDGYFIKVILYCVDHFLYLSFACMLKKHLAQEVCKRVHHQFVESGVFEQ